MVHVVAGEGFEYSPDRAGSCPEEPLNWGFMVTGAARVPFYLARIWHDPAYIWHVSGTT